MLALAIIGGAFIAWFVLAMLFTPVVSDIQGVVAETWLECRGEILTGPETYKPHERAGDVAAFAIKSSPADRSTASRVLFQTLVRSGESIGPDFDALFPARRSVPTGTHPCGAMRRGHHGRRAGAAHRQSILRAQRRGERRVPGRWGRRPLCLRLRTGSPGQQRDHARTVAAGPCGKSSSEPSHGSSSGSSKRAGGRRAGYGWRGVSIAPPFACTLVLVNKR